MWRPLLIALFLPLASQADPSVAARRAGIPACAWQMQSLSLISLHGDGSEQFDAVRRVIAELNRILQGTSLSIPSPLWIELTRGVFQFDQVSKHIRLGCGFPGEARHPFHLESLYAHEYGHAVFDLAVENSLPEFLQAEPPFVSRLLRRQYEELFGYLFQAVWADNGAIVALPDGRNDYSVEPPLSAYAEDHLRIVLWPAGSFIWRSLLAPAPAEKRGDILERVIHTVINEIKARRDIDGIRLLDPHTLNQRLIDAL